MLTSSLQKREPPCIFLDDLNESGSVCSAWSLFNQNCFLRTPRLPVLCE